MKTFVLLTGVEYDSMRQRPQHFADYLVNKGYRVIYTAINSQKVVIRADEFQHMFQYKTFYNYMNKINDRFYTVNRLSKIEEGKEVGFDLFLSNLEKEFGSENTFFLISYPDWYKYINLLSEKSNIIYDCLDDWESFTEKKNFSLNKNLISHERYIAGVSKYVLASSWKLYIKMKHLNKNVVYLPNGTSTKDYSCVNKVPIDMISIKKPIVMFVGAISEWVDKELMDFTAYKRPNYSFVYIGPVFNKEGVPVRDNIHYLGKKNYAELVNYMAQAKVAIIPFEVTKLTASVSPLKYFEYASAGLPTVMTVFPDLEGVGSGSMAVNYEEFIAGIDMYVNMKEKEYELEINKAKAVSEKFEWEKILDSFFENLDMGLQIENIEEILDQQIKIYKKFSENPILKNELIGLYNEIEEYDLAIKIGEELLIEDVELDYGQLCLSYIQRGRMDEAYELLEYWSNKDASVRQNFEYINRNRNYRNELLKISVFQLNNYHYIALNELNALIDSSNDMALYGMGAAIYEQLGNFQLSYNLIVETINNVDEGIKNIFPSTIKNLIEYFIFLQEYEISEELALLLVEIGLKEYGIEKLGQIYLDKHIPMSNENINSKSYWNKRFENDWNSNGGDEQTRFFYNILIENMPEQIVEQLKKQDYSMCDIGCATGEGTEILQKYFSNTVVTGIDFSEKSIEMADNNYPHIEFKCEDIESVKGNYDVIICSNVLEHIENPYKAIEQLLVHTKKYLMVLVPYEEYDRIKEHVYTFDKYSFPTEIMNYNLVFLKEIDCTVLETKWWSGKQALVIYEMKEELIKLVE